MEPTSTPTTVPAAASNKELRERLLAAVDDCDAALLRAVLHDARESHGHAAAEALANLQDTLGETPLHRAVEASWEDGALLLIDGGARCELASLSRTSPLHAAAYAGMVAVCQRILDTAAASTPSATTAETGSTAAVIDLLTLRDEAGDTPLHLAASKGKLAVVSAFATASGSHWPDVARAENDRGLTALDVAQGRQVDVVKFLTKHGCPVGSHKAPGRNAKSKTKRRLKRRHRLRPDGVGQGAGGALAAADDEHKAAPPAS